MNANQLLQWLTQALFVAVFLVALAKAVRHPQRANVDTALLFGVAALIIGLTWAAQVFELPSRVASIGAGDLAMALPYLLLRLLDDFMGVPRIVMRLAETGLVISVVALAVLEQPLPGWLTALLACYFVGLEVYAASRFVSGARGSRGVRRRRMEAVAIASGLLGLTVVLSVLAMVAPPLAGVWSGLSLGTALASGIGYFLGFATPGFLRRGWQEPEVRAFLRSAARLPQLRDAEAIVQTLQSGVAASLGAPHTAIGLWEDAEQVLRFYSSAPELTAVWSHPYDGATGQTETVVGRAFRTQQPMLTPNAMRDDPEHAAIYEATDASTQLAAPITAGETRLGVLVAYGRRAFVFAEEDLELAQLLANHVALALGYARELKERERVELEIAERRQAEAALRHSEARKTAVLETAFDPIISIDHEGRVLEFNAAAERVFGYRREDILGAELVELIIPAQSREQVRERLLRYLATGESTALNQRPETTAMRADETELPIEFAVARMPGSGPTQYTAFLRDISEQKRSAELVLALNADLERRVAERTTQLEDAVKELESFSYTVSHDLRAPLRAVSGFSRILLQEYAPQLVPEAQAHLRTVGENAQQMGRLIDDLLAFSRLGRQPMRTQRVLPAELVRSVLDDLAPDQEDRDVEITVSELAPCQADPVLLKQVYVNLLSNALKYTRRRDVARIHVGSTTTDGEVTYFVLDNGAGFDMRYADKLFGVFQRLHRMEDYEGTGVGLAIVQRILHRHGGRIWAQAAPDQGATFFFTIGQDAVGASEGSTSVSARAA